VATVKVARNANLQAIIKAAGGDPDTAKYDEVAGELEVEGVTTDALKTARDSVVNGTLAPDAEARQAKRRAIRSAAREAAIQALLDADTVFQQKLVDINAATTLAELNAITYP
jgi:hypothetical protein